MNMIIKDEIYIKNDESKSYIYKSFSEVLVLVTIVMLRDILVDQGNMSSNLFLISQLLYNMVSNLLINFYF